ncbi:MAG: SPASM domain-containing protein [Candidatus Latescibacteria bacterium]|jgi:radical SAM protein with 4Fe4S-binding SPASM domain|nr:SPASM domain-containing protein [Candidatus Latescibacterota bacterium]
MRTLRFLPEAALRYHRTFTPHRGWNIAQVAASYVLSRLSGRDVRMGRPFVLMVEPTSICNLSCPLCASGNGTLARRAGTMALDSFSRVLEKQARDLVLLMLWNQGEPFINRDLTGMVRLAKARNITTVTSTNGHFIRSPEEADDVVDSGLDEIIVSLDGATPETYVKYRVGGDFERVIDGARLLVAAKRRRASATPLIHLQFIVMKQNEDEIDAARDLARELQVDHFSVKTAQVYTSDEASTFLPRDNRYSRYRSREGDPVMKSRIPNTCRHLWYSTVVNWDGTVSPCCFDKNGQFPLGDALDNGRSFDEIWSGPDYTAFRNAMLKDRSSIPICSNCSEGLDGLFYDVEVVRP